jgi:hypothetical protein
LRIQDSADDAVKEVTQLSPKVRRRFVLAFMSSLDAVDYCAKGLVGEGQVPEQILEIRPRQ